MAGPWFVWYPSEGGYRAGYRFVAGIPAAREFRPVPDINRLFSIFLTDLILNRPWKKDCALSPRPALLRVVYDQKEKMRTAAVARGVAHFPHFAAAAAPVQEVTVTAVGTDWEYELVGNASEWVTVTEDRTKGLRNGRRRIIRRPNSVPPPSTVNAAGGSGIKVKDKTVTIVQQPSDTPVVYSITVEPASLTFEGGGSGYTEGDRDDRRRRTYPAYRSG